MAEWQDESRFDDNNSDDWAAWDDDDPVPSPLQSFGAWYVNTVGNAVESGWAGSFITAAACLVATWLLVRALFHEEEAPSTRQAGNEHSAVAKQADGSNDLWDWQWRRRLTPKQFAALRRRETDEPNLMEAQGGVMDHWEYGIYRCAGCNAALYHSDAKYDAGCGWPCFYTCVHRAVREQLDPDGVRSELVCNSCSGHLGHLFRGETFGNPLPDERHCVNGSILVFEEHQDPDEGDEGDQGGEEAQGGEDDTAQTIEGGDR